MIELALAGLPGSGKTTLFSALTRGKGEAPPPGGPPRPLRAVVRVPDPRLDSLARLFSPERVVPAEVVYVDSPGALEVRGDLLNTLQKADALVEVVRAFQDPSLPHPLGEVDPLRDIGRMDQELTLADLAVVERRLERLGAQMKGAKPHERPLLQREGEVLQRWRGLLEEGKALREAPIPPEERGLLDNFHLLTARPLLVVLNLGEEALAQAPALEWEVRQRFPGPGREVVSLCARLERDLTGMPQEEEKEFRQALGITEPGWEKVVRASFSLLGLISFFTVVSREVRAWTVPQGTPAVKAAGKIHSDMERGFIRAEVVSFNDLLRCGGLAEARRQGLLRQEGKGYPVRDGDIITFLFSV